VYIAVCGEISVELYSRYDFFLFAKIILNMNLEMCTDVWQHKLDTEFDHLILSRINNDIASYSDTGLMSHTTTPQFPFHLPEPNFQYPTPSGPVMPPPSLIMRGNTNIQQLSSTSPLSTQQRSNQIYTQSYPAENYLRFVMVTCKIV